MTAVPRAWLTLSRRRHSTLISDSLTLDVASKTVNMPIRKPGHCKGKAAARATCCMWVSKILFRATYVAVGSPAAAMVE